MSEEKKVRGEIIVKLLHDCDAKRVAKLMGSFHSDLALILGKNCRMHGVFNAYQGEISKLGEADTEFFFERLTCKFKATGNQPILGAVIDYQTRTRVCQASYAFDQTLGTAMVSFTMPDPAQGIRPKQVRDLLWSIMEIFDPVYLSYNSGIRLSF